MLLIPCPWCGERGEAEFRFGAEPVVRPALAADDAAWGEYLFGKENAKGAHREVWCHAGGCGMWFVMERDTVTHAILGTAAP